MNIEHYISESLFEGVIRQPPKKGGLRLRWSVRSFEAENQNPDVAKRRRWFGQWNRGVSKIAQNHQTCYTVIS